MCKTTSNSLNKKNSFSSSSESSRNSSSNSIESSRGSIDSSRSSLNISETSNTSNNKKLQLLTIKNHLPSDVFIKSLFSSFFYLFIDLFMWFTSLYIAIIITKSEYWKTIELYQQILFSFLYWNFTGFFMWCLFVSLLIFLVYFTLSSFISISHSISLFD